jgi:hypothetical protein
MRARTHKKRRRANRRKSKRHNKSGPIPTINKKNMKESGGPVDEKGNPLPLDNPEGGDPICPGGYKIDYDFDPFNDPINPPFRCISALIDPNDGKQYNNNNNINTSNQLQTDEDTIRGGSGRTTTIRNIKKYRPTSYSKTRRRYQRHAS